MSTADEVPAAAAVAVARLPHPYLCYQCNSVVSLTPPSDSDLHCPLCNGDDCLEEHHPDPVHLFPLLDDSALSTTSSNDHRNTIFFSAPFHEGAASKEAVEALPCVKITEVLIDRSDSDSGGVQCAVCMSDFELGSEAKQMPCKHMFHSDCILPWLELQNSCPVCRYELPTEYDEGSDWCGDGSDGGGGGSETLERRFRICLPWPLTHCFWWL